MSFDPTAYGPVVAEILALDGNGERLMPLVATGNCPSQAANLLRAHQPKEVLKKARGPKGAWGALWLYFSAFDESHAIIQDLQSDEAKYWHAILHRQEPDPGNAGYWFRQLGTHPVFKEVSLAASKIVERIPDAEFRCSWAKWDPFAFVAFCERARHQPGSPSETAAREIQRAEWQALFDYCAGPRKR
ncbi:MAG: hypothetical protein ABI823_06200 [Bryobacteraceae bacterium]